MMDLYKNNKIALSLFIALFLGLQLINSVSAADKIPVINNASGPSISFTASPSTISIGHTSKLEWKSPSADSCKFVGGAWFGLGDASIPTSGDKDVNPSKDTTYKIYCTNKSGTIPSYVTVSVNRCPAGNSCHGATIDLKINGSHGPVPLTPPGPNKLVQYIGTVKLTSTRSLWSIFTPTPDFCTWWNGDKIAQLGPGDTWDIGGTLATGSHTVVASCTFNFSGDQIVDSVNVVVEKPISQPAQTQPAQAVTPTPVSTPAPTVNLYVRHATDPPTTKYTSINIVKGESAYLSWSSTNANTCSATWTEKTSASGSETKSNLSVGTHAFSLECKGSGGSATDSVNVKVVASPTITNGSCGSANGVTASSAPSTNLCNAGTASTPSGTGPWTWTCSGSNGGTTASCSAPKSSQPLPPSVDIWINLNQ